MTLCKNMYQVNSQLMYTGNDYKNDIDIDHVNNNLHREYNIKL